MNIEFVIDIVKEAAVLMKTNSFDISQKGGYSNIVTSSDIAVQDFLCDKLAKLLPGSGFFCEEKDLHNSSAEYTWVIDPIDGTANYSRGIAQCAICVGLKHFSDIELGVVYLPIAKELFYAERHKGAFLNSHQIHVSDRPFQNAIMCTALAVYHKEYADVCSNIIMKTFQQCNDIRRFGACAPELCYLAMGRCELYFEYMLSPWDYAAASLILTEAGGTISSLNGSPITFTEPCGVIAGNNPENYNKLLEIVKKEIE